MVVWSLLAPGTSSLQTKKINWLIVLQNNNIKHSFLPLFSPICEQPEGRKVEDKIQMNHLNLMQPSGLSKQAPTVPINPPGSKMGESMWKQNQGLLQMEIAYFTQGNVWSIIYKLYADQLGLSQRSITLRKKYWYIRHNDWYCLDSSISSLTRNWTSQFSDKKKPLEKAHQYLSNTGSVTE